jgi:hypothetical protein
MYVTDHYHLFKIKIKLNKIISYLPATPTGNKIQISDIINENGE